MGRPARTIEELLLHLAVVYKAKINANTVCYIGQAREGAARSQYLCLTIHDTKTGRFVVLRLSTFRKLVHWVTSRGWLEARRLTDVERRIMERRIMERREAIQRLQEDGYCVKHGTDLDICGCDED